MCAENEAVGRTSLDNVSGSISEGRRGVDGRGGTSGSGSGCGAGAKRAVEDAVGRLMRASVASDIPEERLVELERLGPLPPAVANDPEGVLLPVTAAAVAALEGVVTRLYSLS